MTNAFSPSPWETKASGSLSSRPALSTELLPGQSELQSETLFQKLKINLKKKSSVPEITASKTFVTADLNVVFSFAFACDAGLYCLFSVCGGDGYAALREP